MDIQEKQKYKQKFIEKYLEYKNQIVQKEPLRKCWIFVNTFFWLLANAIPLFIGYILFSLCISSTTGENASNSLLDTTMTYVCVFAGLVAIYVGMHHFFDKFNLKKKFSRIIKGICFSGLMRTFDFIENGYDPEYSVTLSGLVSSSLSGDTKLVIDDRFYGCYKDVFFHITELSNGMIRGKKGVYCGPWKGIVLSLKLNKYASSRIDVIPTSDKGDITMLIVGLIACLLSLFGFKTDFISSFFIFIFCFAWTAIVAFSFWHNKYKKVNLEDINIGKQYYVQAANQVDARYILTPVFIEKINNLKKLFNAKRMWCSFEGYRMTMAFETKQDLFEIGNLNIPTTDPRQAEQFFNEVIAITDIIDHFKLYEKTGL